MPFGLTTDQARRLSITIEDCCYVCFYLTWVIKCPRVQVTLLTFFLAIPSFLFGLVVSNLFPSLRVVFRGLLYNTSRNGSWDQIDLISPHQCCTVLCMRKVGLAALPEPESAVPN